MECNTESNTRFARFRGSMRKAGDFDDERYSVWGGGKTEQATTRFSLSKKGTNLELIGASELPSLGAFVRDGCLGYAWVIKNSNIQKKEMQCTAPSFPEGRRTVRRKEEAVGR